MPFQNIDAEAFAEIHNQEVEERKAYDWEAALAMCSQYSIECADGFTFPEYVEEEWNETNDLFDIYS